VTARPVDPPLRRPLKVFAFDPMRGRAPLSVISLEVENERLDRGPQGARVQVIDYDSSQGAYYTPVDLNEPAILMQGGLEPTEADPRFHQQMVYAVTMKVLENFDRALGRRITFRGKRLRLFPHAFQGPNAFFEPKLGAVCFGYFKADSDNPGENLPGQTVFSCLSQDIIAHEVTHAVVHRLREDFLEPTNEDVLAFHEGFADIVAIFQHFTFPDVLRDAIQETQGKLSSSKSLIDLATQFGHATGRGGALRTALDNPDPKRYREVIEPHSRGSILVAAVFDAFFATYQARVEDLLRIATAGTGVLPQGALHPDLVDRLAREAAEAAQGVLTMCIRAFEYLPPVDITFGDYLRAVVTADYDLVADQGVDQRRAMVEAFRRRGIYPEDVLSLAEDSLIWTRVGDVGIERMPAGEISRRMLSGAQSFQARSSSELPAEPKGVDPAAPELHAWATRNARLLDLDPDCKIETKGFHATYRVTPRGELVIEVIAQFAQMHETSQEPEYGGLPLRGGSTVVAGANGEVRFVISKPLPSKAIREPKQREAEARRERQLEFVRRHDAIDPALPWADERQVKRRMRAQDFRALHQGLMA
jgi:hypothetical protein